LVAALKIFHNLIKNHSRNTLNTKIFLTAWYACEYLMSKENAMSNYTNILLSPRSRFFIFQFSIFKLPATQKF